MSKRWEPVVNSSEVLVDAFGRVHGVVHNTVEGLSTERLTFRAGPAANTIAWLVWHLTRIQDDHVAGVAGTDQVWTKDGWAGRFDLPFEETDTGFGHDSDDIAALQVEADLLLAYHDAVHAASIDYVSRLSAEELDAIVDERWDPPVTLGVRLISVINDDMQHAGQAAFVKGLAERS
jgi:hypothetical protein